MYQRLDEAQQEKLGEVIEATFQAATALFRHMAEIRLTSELRTAYLEHVFPRTAKQRAEDVKPERWERIMTILGDERWTPRQTWETLWALYNAVVRDEDYRETREREPERRLERVWFGSGSEIKLKALDRARRFDEQAAGPVANAVGEH